MYKTFSQLSVLSKYLLVTCYRDTLAEMSLGLKEVEAPPSRQSEVPLEDIALQFFNLMYEKKHPIEMTRSPETQPKLQKVLSDGLAPAAAAPGAQATHPQAGQGNDDRARARHVS